MSVTWPQRWQTYAMERGETLRPFWSEHFKDVERSILFVLAESFDPRSTLALQQLLDADGGGLRDVIALEYEEGESGKYKDRTATNRAAIEESCKGRASLQRVPLEFYADGRRVVSARAGEIFHDAEQIARYTDIVIDVSGMPRTVFFPLVARLLYFVDADSSKGGNKNLFVVVSEDPSLDAAIEQEGIDEFADFLPMFRGGFDQEATAERPAIWLPLLGEHRAIQLDRILDRVKPDEVCPVLPSPARNPRRGDILVLEYRTLLFDQLRLDPRAFLYAAEQNPFQVYRELRSAVERYQEALAPLGGCKVAMSALSSKLTSVGMLLAAYELKCLGIEVGIAHIDCQTYQLTKTEMAPEFFVLWLAGECYGG